MPSRSARNHCSGSERSIASNANVVAGIGTVSVVTFALQYSRRRVLANGSRGTAGRVRRPFNNPKQLCNATAAGWNSVGDLLDGYAPAQAWDEMFDAPDVPREHYRALHDLLGALTEE